MIKASLRNVLAHKGRLALSTLAVLLGVAFVSGTLVFSDTVNAAFAGISGSTAADLTIKPKQAFVPEVEDRGVSGETPTLPAGAVAEVAAVPGIRAARGQVALQNLTVVDRDGRAVGPTTGAPTLGQNWTDDPQVHLAQGRAPTRAGEIVLDEASARHKNLHLGDPLRVLTPAGSAPGTLVGTVTYTTGNPGLTMAYLDTATAQQQLLGKPGQFTGITADTAPGTSRTAAQKAVKSVLGDAYSVATKEEQAATAAQQISSFLSVATTALLGFAALAVLVGVFLILNTFSMLVAQRTREIGLLRALGAGRAQVLRSVLLEALLLGLAGSTLGLGAGIGLAAALTSLVSRFGVDLSGTALVIGPATPAAAYAVGVLVTLLAAYLPARRAARTTPMAALRDHAPSVPQPPGPSARRAALGTALLLVGAGLLYGAATHHGTLTIAGALLGGGITATLLAMVVLGPALTRLVVHTLGAPLPTAPAPRPNWSPPTRAVRRGRPDQPGGLRRPEVNAVRKGRTQTRRTGATAGALMISLSLVGAVAVLAAYKEEMIKSQVDQLLYMVYGLLGLTIVVAVLGVVNTLALSVIERTREIGLLRAIGLSRRQLRRVVRLESVVIALFGAVLGTALGLSWGVTARSVLADQGLTALTIPTGTVAVVLAGSVLIGLIAALVPAFRAARMNVLAAIASD
nr:FtsX-like permease family protein [Streptomyces sp. Li-HN-5-13]